MATDRPRILCVSGMIGAGKSTLSLSLAELTGYHHVAEPVSDNPYLSLFYSDPAKWAYPMQEYLRARRIAGHQFAYWGTVHGAFRGAVTDRSVHEDAIFAQANQRAGNIHPLNLDTYKLGASCSVATMPEPDLYLFLDVPVDVCLSRIVTRGRPEESRTHEAYFRDLHADYASWFDAAQHRLPALRIDWRKFRSTQDVWEEISTRSHEWRPRSPERPRGWWSP